MKAEEVHGLLATAAMYDEREPLDYLREWSVAAERFEWVFEEVEAKIHDWYGEGTDFVTPVDLRPERRPGEGPNPTGPPAGFDHIDEAIDWVAIKLGWASSEVRRALLGVDCGFCRSKGGQKCRRTTRTTGIGWVRVGYFHPVRYGDVGLPQPDQAARVEASRTHDRVTGVAPVTRCC